MEDENIEPKCLDSAPQDAVQDIKAPSSRDYRKLKNQLDKANRDWTENFLKVGGLAVLFDSLIKVCSSSNRNVHGGLQLDCVACIKSVVDSRIGLDYIIENREYTDKLAVALDTTNEAARKQIYELLSALCVYNVDGYERALQTLEKYRDMKNEASRYKILLDELKKAKNVDFQTAVVAFINCIIISTADTMKRNRIRNEFIALKILDVISKLRNDHAENSVSDLLVQLDVFEEQREADESHSSGHGVDLSSHLDIFFTIFKQTMNTPQEVPFLNILQHFLKIDSSQAISDIIWETAETLVHRAILVESKEDSKKLLQSRSFSQGLNKLKFGDGRCQCSCHKEEGPDGKPKRKRSITDIMRTQSIILSPTSLAGSNSSFAFPQSPPPPPPPPPPLPPNLQQHDLPDGVPIISCGGPFMCPPPPPPPPPQLNGSPPAPPPPPIPSSHGQNGAQIPGTNKQFGIIDHVLVATPNIKLPQQETPAPKSKMKTLNWNKIPDHKIVGKANLWSKVAKVHNAEDNDLDFGAMEDLFCLPIGIGTAPGSPSLGRSTDSLERRKKEPHEINLLDGKRNLNVNIFLKQFRTENDEIIKIVSDGRQESIGAEKLRGLLKILPESDEVEMLKNFDGDKSRLGHAEKFLCQLIKLPSYKLRIEGMLLKEEFATNMQFLESAINTFVLASQELQENSNLQSILYFVLVAGNFLNSGGYAGNAAGFKMMSLLKLTDIRANKPGMNLIHYVAMQAEKKDEKLLNFVDDLKYLEDASRLSIDNLKSELRNLEQKVVKITTQVGNSSSIIKEQMDEFLMFASEEVKKIQSDVEMLEHIRTELAEFLCEEPTPFKFEECFKVFWTFCNKFKTAVQDNKKRKLQEEQSAQRRRQRAEINLKKAPLELKLSSGDPNKESHIMDMLLGDIRQGFLQRKVTPPEFNVRRVRKTTLESGGELSRKNSKAGSITSEEDGSGSPMLIRRRFGNTDHTDGFTTDSPDVTPNGTLRRRRSRITSDDNEENLLGFLRQGSEQESMDSKERRSWSGVESNSSLERSWSRRSGRRRRPDLLSADFLSPDRERPSSPMSPRMERKNVNTNAGIESPKTPRQWKKKIEDWFQVNDKEESADDFRSQRRASSRRRREQELPESDGTDSSRFHESKTDTELLQRRPYHKQGAEPTTDIEKTRGYKERKNSFGNQIKDKSRWRKSTMNVANSTEAVDDDDSKRRGRKSGYQQDSNIVPIQNVPSASTTSLDVIKEHENNEIAIRQSELPDLTKVPAKKTESNSSSDIEKDEDIPTDTWEKILKNQASNSEDKVKSEGESGRNSSETILADHGRQYSSMRELGKIQQDDGKYKSNVSLTKGDSDESDPSRLERMARRSQRYKKFVEATSKGDISLSRGNSETSINVDEKEEDDAEKFDRFSVVRRTQRFKQLAKDNERKQKEDEVVEVDASGNIVSSENRVPKDRRSRKWGSNVSKTDIDKILEDIEQTGNEIQDIGVCDQKEVGSVEGVRSPLSDQDESKPKDKSFKARLSRKLHSLAENIKSATRSTTEVGNKMAECEAQEDEGLQVLAAKPIPATPELPRKTYTSEDNVTISGSTELDGKVPLVRCHSLVGEEGSEIAKTKEKTEPMAIEKKPSLDSIASGSPVSLPSPSVRRHVTRSPDTDGDTEKDEGFEETQSLLSETHSQDEPNNSKKSKETITKKKLTQNSSRTLDKPKKILKASSKPALSRTANRTPANTTITAYQALQTLPKQSKRPATNLSKPSSTSKNSLRGSNKSLRTSNSSIASDKSKSSVIFRPYGAAGRPPSVGSQSSSSSLSAKGSDKAKGKEVKSEIKKYTKAINGMTNNIEARKNVDRPTTRPQRSNSTNFAGKRIEKSSSFNLAPSNVKKPVDVKRTTSVRSPITKTTLKMPVRSNSSTTANADKPRSPVKRSTSKNLSFMRATSSSAAKSTPTTESAPILKVKVKAGNIKPSSTKTVRKTK